MKKMLFVAVLAIALALGMGGIAMANYGPHGGYLADTDACAGCHRAHVAFSDLTWQDAEGYDRNPLLVSEATTMYDFCIACHGNDKPGAATNVQGGKLDTAISGDTQAQTGEVNAILNGGGFEFTGWGNADGTTKGIGTAATITVDVSQKVATGQHDCNTGDGSWNVGSTIWGSWGPGANNGPGKQVDLTCTNCHDPHGSSNYRILLDATNEGRAIGGYLGNFATDVDPTPDPWVLSNEIGYPNGVDVSGATDNSEDVGWRLHKNMWTNMDGTAQTGDYMPDYTNASYATSNSANSVNTSGTAAADAPKTEGMTGWCTRGCHDQYMVIEGNYENPTDTSYGTFNVAGTYNPGDGSDARNRHRHPMNVPLTRWYKNGAEAQGPRGDRALIYEPTMWQGWDASVKFVDIPLEHRLRVSGNTGGEGSPYNTYDASIVTATEQGSQVNNVVDVLECLTCHRAHGSSASMTGYAGSGSNVNPSRFDYNQGTPPTYDNALLRADNRGVCERCHNK